jgi:enoyl-CoA hydratase/carnithine racemase
MAMKHLELSYEGDTIRVTFSTGEEGNVMTHSFMREMTDFLESLKYDRKSRFVVIRGRGDFGLGPDVRELYAGLRSRQQIERYLALMKAMYITLLDVTKITVSVLDGMACDSSLELALLTDIVVADKGAKLCIRWGSMGLLPPVLLALSGRIVEARAVKRLAILGEELKAEEAKELGLIYDYGNVEELVNRIINQVRQSAPTALSRMKRFLYINLQDTINRGFDLLMDQLSSPQASEGIMSLIYKTKPEWKS